MFIFTFFEMLLSKYRSILPPGRRCRRVESFNDSVKTTQKLKFLEIAWKVIELQD